MSLSRFFIARTYKLEILQIKGDGLGQIIFKLTMFHLSDSAKARTQQGVVIL